MAEAAPAATATAKVVAAATVLQAAVAAAAAAPIAAAGWAQKGSTLAINSLHYEMSAVVMQVIESSWALMNW